MTRGRAIFLQLPHRFLKSFVGDREQSKIMYSKYHFVENIKIQKNKEELKCMVVHR